jgi:hypothetical protein
VAWEAEAMLTAERLPMVHMTAAIYSTPEGGSPPFR